MLFRSQMEAVIPPDSGESLYFAGASLLPVNAEQDMMHILGIKQTDGTIRVSVDYLGMRHDRKNKEHDRTMFTKVMDAVTFERFINDMAMTVAKQNKQNRLFELNYKSRGITHPDGDRMTDEERHHLYKLFLIIATNTKDMEKAYEGIDQLLSSSGRGSSGMLDNFVQKYFATA